MHIIIALPSTTCLFTSAGLFMIVWEIGRGFLTIDFRCGHVAGGICMVVASQWDDHISMNLGDKKCKWMTIQKALGVGREGLQQSPVPSSQKNVFFLIFCVGRPLVLA